MTAQARSRRPRFRVSANPISYWAKGNTIDKSPAVLEQAFADLSQIGFTAVKADVPNGMSAAGYRSWLESYGLEPAIGLFSSPFDETIAIAAEVERARVFAAQQAELGLDRTMVSSMSLPARMDKPGVGAGFDAGRLALAIENCAAVCGALRSQGLQPLHHSHAGGVFETEAEVTQLLDDLGPDVIGFGPDTGHLTLAGADPVDLMRRYADRVGGIHVKDCFADYLDPKARQGLTYHDISATQRLWAEPGLGVVDLDGVLAALPDDFDGDVMIEVDVPSVHSARESHRISFEWAQGIIDRP